MDRKGNITDPESGILKSSHGSIQGYNGIALVDARHQIVVSTTAYGLNQEHETLLPVVEQAKVLHGKMKRGLWRKRKPLFLGDTGYFSQSNLKYLAGEGFDYLIPDTQFRKRDERFKSRIKPGKFDGMFKKEHFAYDHRKDSYRCPGGKYLKRKGKPLPYRQGVARWYSSQQADCTACKIRSNCLSEGAKKKQILQPLTDGINYCELMRSKIDLPENREIYSRRMAIVEPVFGNIRFQKGLNYFTLRGRRKVNIQWKLFAMVHNIEKYAKYGKI